MTNAGVLKALGAHFTKTVSSRRLSYTRARFLDIFMEPSSFLTILRAIPDLLLGSFSLKLVALPLPGTQNLMRED